MYSVLLTRRMEKIVLRLDNRIDNDAKFSPHAIAESTLSTTRLNSKQLRTDGLIKKVKSLNDSYNPDDPFQRRGLRPDKKNVKLAEIDPIESEGRNLRAKLQLSLERATGNEPIILVWKAMEYQMKNYKDHFEFITPPECGSCRITVDRTFVSECAALVHFNSPDLRKFLDIPDPNAR